MSSVDKTTIEDLQKKDSTLKKCFDRIGKPIIRENSVGEFYMKNGLLYRKHQETKTGRSSNQLVVPKGLRQQVMSMNHESAFRGHLGAKKTEVRIISNFFLPGLRQDVIRFCRSCDVCQRTVKKGHVKKVQLGSMPLFDTPFKRVAVDIVGPIAPPSESQTQTFGSRRTSIDIRDSNKLLMQWRGPYTVESRVGANDYRIKMGSKTKTYHLNMLKKYIVREPEVEVVQTSNKDDATVAVARVIYQDTDPELGEVPDLEGGRQRELIN